MNDDKITYTDDYEKEVIEAFESDDYVPIRNEKLYNELILGTAAEGLTKEDENFLRKEAIDEGIPYTSKLMQVLHQYVKEAKKKQAV